MKSLLKLGGFGYHFLVLSIGIIMAFSFAGCQTTDYFPEPITDSIVAEIGGFDNTSRLQFYLSKAMTLTLVSDDNDTIIEDGLVVRRNATARETIIIPEDLPVLAQSYAARSNRSLGVSLLIAIEEDNEENQVIAFGKYRAGNNERYQILYTDIPNRIISYGGYNYVVTYDGDEPPYLLIRMRQSDDKTESTREVSGLTLTGD